MQQCVAQLRQELQRQGTDYLCESALDGTQAQIRFLGRFKGDAVVWDAHLQALGAAASSAQFIEIDAATPRGQPIRIGLTVARIDRPTVLKTIIMVRNYKRLHLGRHEFGPQGRVADTRQQRR